MENKTLTLKPIAKIRTCFQEKFGIPRQSLMIPSAKGTIQFYPDARIGDSLRHLEEFSHIWVIFVFNQSEWRPLTTTPRLDAPGKVGVFASRSPYRPNPIGMSVVKLEKINWGAKPEIEIEVSGVDILDGTEVLDIKPYLPYTDSVMGASGSWTESQIPQYEVTYSDEALKILNQLPEQKNLIHEMLKLDPRPTSQKEAFRVDAPGSESKKFAFRVDQYDIHFEIRSGGFYVLNVF